MPEMNDAAFNEACRKLYQRGALPWPELLESELLHCGERDELSAIEACIHERHLREWWRDAPKWNLPEPQGMATFAKACFDRAALLGAVEAIGEKK